MAENAEGLTTVEKVVGKQYRPALELSFAVLVVVAAVLGGEHLLGDYVDTRARLVWATDATRANDLHQSFATRLDGHDAQLQAMRANNEEITRLLRDIASALKAR